MNTKIIKVDFSPRGKSLRDMKKIRTQEKKDLRLDDRINKAVARSWGVA